MSIISNMGIKIFSTVIGVGGAIGGGKISHDYLKKQEPAILSSLTEKQKKEVAEIDLEIKDFQVRWEKLKSGNISFIGNISNNLYSIIETTYSAKIKNLKFKKWTIMNVLEDKSETGYRHHDSCLYNEYTTNPFGSRDFQCITDVRFVSEIDFKRSLTNLSELEKKIMDNLKILDILKSVQPWLFSEDKNSI